MKSHSRQMRSPSLMPRELGPVPGWAGETQAGNPAKRLGDGVGSPDFRTQSQSRQMRSPSLLVQPQGIKGAGGWGRQIGRNQAGLPLGLDHQAAARGWITRLGRQPCGNRPNGFRRQRGNQRLVHDSWIAASYQHAKSSPCPDSPSRECCGEGVRQVGGWGWIRPRHGGRQHEIPFPGWAFPPMWGKSRGTGLERIDQLATTEDTYPMTRRYPLDTKIASLNQLDQNDGDLKMTSDLLEIPPKTLERWRANEVSSARRLSQATKTTSRTTQVRSASQNARTQPGNPRTDRQQNPGKSALESTQFRIDRIAQPCSEVGGGYAKH